MQTWSLIQEERNVLITENRSALNLSPLFLSLTSSFIKRPLPQVSKPIKCCRASTDKASPNCCDAVDVSFRKVCHGVTVSTGSQFGNTCGRTCGKIYNDWTHFPLYNFFLFLTIDTCRHLYVQGDFGN